MSFNKVRWIQKSKQQWYAITQEDRERFAEILSLRDDGFVKSWKTSFSVKLSKKTVLLRCSMMYKNGGLEKLVIRKKMKKNQG